MFDGPLIKNCQVRGPASDIDERNAEFSFVIGKRRLAGSKLLKDDVMHSQAGLVDAFHDILGRGDRRCYDVDLGFQTNSRHS